MLENARRDEPGAADVNFYLGISLLMVGKPEDAVARLQTAAASEKSSYTQTAHVFLAKAYIQTANFARAEAELQKAAFLPGRLTNQARSLLTQVQALRNSTQPIQSGKPN
jgi:predicted Zn-dependent protease